MTLDAPIACRHLEPLENALVLLLTRAARAEASSGYGERAVGLLVAVIEANVYVPEEFRDASWSARLDAFEEFWESEAPRIGDEGGEGWCKWWSGARVSSAVATGPPAAPVDDTGGSDAGGTTDGVGADGADDDGSGGVDTAVRRVLATWAGMEARQERLGVLPLRASTAPTAVDEDPESVVLASDVLPYLLPIRTERARAALFVEVVALLGVPADPHEEISSAHPRALVAQASLHAHAAARPLGLPVPPMAPTAPRVGIIASVRAAGAGAGKDGAANLAYARRLLHAACETFPTDVTLARLLMATSDRAVSVRRLARPLLKRSPASLPLWLAYSTAEVNSGNALEAGRVCAKALALANPSAGQTSSPLEMLPLALSGARRALEADGLHSTRGAMALRWLVGAFVPEVAASIASAAAASETHVAAEEAPCAVEAPLRTHVLLARRGLADALGGWLPAPPFPPRKQGRGRPHLCSPLASGVRAPPSPCLAESAALADVPACKAAGSLGSFPLSLDEQKATVVSSYALLLYLGAGGGGSHAHAGHRGGSGVAGLCVALDIYERAQSALATPQAGALAEAAISKASAHEAGTEPGTLTGGLGGLGDGVCLLLGAGSAAHERLIEQWLWLLRLHSATSRPPPAREAALYTAALTHFPANGPVLSTLAAGGLGGLGSFELRHLLTSARARHPRCPQLWLCALRFESSGGLDGATGPLDHTSHARNLAAASAVVPRLNVMHRQRRLLEAALSPSACPGSAALWLEYLQLELHAGRSESASRVFLRAVRQCPGAKSLWLAGLSPPLAGCLPPKQLEDALRLMADKEVRIRRLPRTPEVA